MFCKHCGTKNLKDSQFCKKCGVEFLKEELNSEIVDAEINDNENEYAEEVENEPEYGKALLKIIELSMPFVLVMNFFGGIVGGIWILILGEWRFVIFGILVSIIFVFIYTIILMIIQNPIWIGALFEKKYKKLALFLTAIGLIIGYIIDLFWVFLVFASVAYLFNGLNLLPFFIFGYSIAVGPFQYMASREGPDALGTYLVVWLNSISYLLLVICFYLNITIIAIILIIIIALMTLFFTLKTANFLLNEEE